jgi:hypothetical protein
VNKAFKAAFDVVQQELGDSVRFLLILDRYHGVSGTVSDILYYWIASGESTKDAPGTTYRFRMSDYSAEVYADQSQGGKELYDKATDVFLKTLGLR